MIEFLEELHAELGGDKCMNIWDGLHSHRSKAMKAFLKTQRDWLVVEQLPGLRTRPQPHRARLGKPQVQRTGQSLPGQHRRSCRGRRSRPGTDRRRCRALLGIPAPHRSFSVTDVSMYGANLINRLTVHQCRLRGSRLLPASAVPVRNPDEVRRSPVANVPARASRAPLGLENS